MPSEGRLTLLGLPAELRNYIFELAVIHEDGNGVIAPLRRRSRPTVLRVVEQTSGVKSPTTDNQSQTPGSDDSSSEREEVRSDQEQALTLLSDPANTHAHQSCTLDCLLQPPVTRVNRQIREEVLSLFYAVKQFHIELSRFTISKPGEIAWIETRIPADWWRAIGDTNFEVYSPSGYRRTAVWLIRYSSGAWCDCDVSGHTS